jgi:cobaltochelatase CobS
MKMKKYIIKSIVKTGEGKAQLKYERNGKPVATSRAVYTNDGAASVLFKGIRLEVNFNDLGVATKIEAKEIYDEKVKREDGTRIDNIKLEIQNENGLDIQKLKVEVPKPAPQKKEQPGVIKHMKFDQIKACVEAEVPVYLYGPAGSGKNHVLQQIAEELGLEFYFTNSVQQEFKITGFIDAGGNFHETEFYKAFKNGGLFFLDEMDASIPEVLVLLNAALANGYFEFPTGKITAHENFRVVAAGNTVGTGADEQYSGRLQLDQATLDRFAMIEFDYDRNIELKIAKGNEELVQFIRSLRNQAKQKGINCTFSYRCISMVTKLEGKLELKEVVRMAVVKGLDEDTIRTFNTSPNNKYSKALWVLSQVKAG